MDDLINRSAHAHSNELWDMWKRHDPLLGYVPEKRQLPWESRRHDEIRDRPPAPIPPPGAFPDSDRDHTWEDETEEEQDMRGLYKVYIVDPEFDLVVYQGDHIATDDGAAKMRAALKAVLDKDIDDYDLIVVRLGNVRDKSEIKSQMVTAALLDRLGTVERKAPQLKEAIDRGSREQ